MGSSNFLNPSAKQWRHLDNECDPQTGQQQQPSTARLELHKKLPHYSQTPLHSLPSVAKELGLGHVLLKDESSRFGLPSFKILAASWAVYRAVTEQVQDSDSRDVEVQSLSTIGKQARGRGLKLLTCTAGNWGRAVARMAEYMGVPVVVYVASNMPEMTRNLIRGEGAEVVPVDGGYDDAVAAMKVEAEKDGYLMVVDIAWEGYETIPQWVIEGYQTMLEESDAQVLAATESQAVTHAIIPCGCGSVAQAVTQHFKSAAREQQRELANASVIAVEPTAAACLMASLRRGEMTSVSTEEHCIMNGMNAGVLSTTAWPVLKQGVDVSVVVSDFESHNAVKDLDRRGIQAGPCGAACLAALRRLCETAKEDCMLNERSVVVLYCTEGAREYELPLAESGDDDR
ncbi:tryptophan synthase beta subunit-like PLP-dependent enzyme [Apodospora peruviana]|uniref:Tryptophan synthase beta subunit-like PLP-dependent enzyme n=1 Tax=Apodospora peruviana TaxID=516989 RepID=A0AAE0IRY9_9PEZI|nr:tryptophan synthase beta subunit-like PLP-dependent enzyme [Apodospora peruviana]